MNGTEEGEHLEERSGQLAGYFTDKIDWIREDLDSGCVDDNLTQRKLCLVLFYGKSFCLFSQWKQTWLLDKYGPPQVCSTLAYHGW